MGNPLTFRTFQYILIAELEEKDGSIVATIWDVAKCAGVSKSTVSLVINNSPLVKIETKQRVEDAIEQLGYVCNNNARGLRKRETKCLGIIVATESKTEQTYEYDYETGLFSYNISNGIPTGLVDTDYGLLTERYCAAEAKGEMPSIVKNSRVDGLFLVGGLFEDCFIDELLKRKIPTVAVGKYYSKIDCIYPDVRGGTRDEVSYLLHNGHTHIAYINCPQAYTASQARLNGFQDACAKYKDQIRQSWTTYCSQNTGAGGYEAIKALWEAGARPDAIATANEPIALGVMRFLYEQKIRIPEDISIVSYEDSVLGGYATPALTTVNIHKEYMGSVAASMLLRRLEDPGREVESILVKPELVIRSSVTKSKNLR